MNWKSLFLLMAIPFLGHSQQRILDFTIKGAENDTVHLAMYYGNKLFYKDTAVCNAKGQCEFDRSKDLPGGVYALVVGKSSYFEFILNEDELDIHADAKDLNGTRTAKKSEENKVFFSYVEYLGGKKKEANKLAATIKEESDPMKKSLLEEQLKSIDKDVKAYQKDLIEENKDLFVADVVRMSVAVELEQPMKEDGTLDTAASYYQYREHYWDHFNLTDPRIIHTPVFHAKVEEYITKTVPQKPDTITHFVDELITRLGDNQDAFQYITHFTTHHYETSDIMGMDAVFVHMGQKYYCPADGESRVDWMKDDKLEQLCERIGKLSPLIIGKKAPFLKLTDTTEQNWISYYDLPNDFIVIIFWDPHCGACKKELPVMKEVYDKELKKMGVEVFAVAKAVEEKAFLDWKEYIRKEELDWVNVGLTVNVYAEAKADARKFIPEFTTLASLNYGDAWDVYSTPKVFVVDKERRIIGKQLAPEQIVDLVKHKMEAGK